MSSISFIIYVRARVVYVYINQSFFSISLFNNPPRLLYFVYIHYHHRRRYLYSSPRSKGEWSAIDFVALKGEFLYTAASLYVHLDDYDTSY